LQTLKSGENIMNNYLNKSVYMIVNASEIRLIINSCNSNCTECEMNEFFCCNFQLLSFKLVVMLVFITLPLAQFLIGRFSLLPLKCKNGDGRRNELGEINRRRNCKMNYKS